MRQSVLRPDMCFQIYVQYIAFAAVNCEHTTVSLRISVVLRHIVIGTPAVWSLLRASHSMPGKAVITQSAPKYQIQHI